MKMTRGALTMPQILILSLALGAFLAPRGVGAQEEARLQGNDVAVYNLAGHVEVVAGSGSDVVVQIMRGGDDADQLSFETIQADGREALVVHYPGDRIIYSELGRNSRTQLRSPV